MINFYRNLRKHMRPIKVFSKKILRYFSKFVLLFIPNIILDYSLERKKFCKNGLISFSIRNYGEVCRFRSSTFAIKEPDTLKWIESFDKNSTFIDIGANVGIYSIYASHFTSQVFSFEPDALNYSLLNLNILDNNLAGKILAYPLSIHNKCKFDTLNIQNYQYGGALSSFANQKDQFQKSFLPVFKQGSFSITLDDIFEKIIKNNSTPPQEIHCKIDVDGNEKIILEGANETFRSKNIKSFLVELDNTRDDYETVIKFFKNYGYALVSMESSPVFKEVFETTQNHIFYAK